MIRVAIVLLFLSQVVSAQVNVRLVTDEAEAVLSILAKKKANEAITEADWQRVFQSEGYVRLKKRETSMQRSFEDGDFRTFVLSLNSPSVLRRCRTPSIAGAVIWDKEVGNFNTDLKKVEKFLLDVVEDKLTEDEARKTGYSFFGIQGPWYTVGWKMSVLIERAYGRAKLIECFCDQRKLLSTYNQAAERHNRGSRDQYALWSNSLITRVQNGKSQTN